MLTQKSTKKDTAVGSIAGEKMISISKEGETRSYGSFSGAVVQGPYSVANLVLKRTRTPRVSWEGNSVCNLAVAGHETLWKAVLGVAEADSNIYDRRDATLWIEPLGIPGDSRNNLALSLRVFQLPSPLHEIPTQTIAVKSRAFYQVTQQIQEGIQYCEEPFGQLQKYPENCIQLTASTPAELFPLMDALSVIAQRLNRRVLARPVLSTRDEEPLVCLSIQAFPPQTKNDV